LLRVGGKLWYCFRPLDPGLVRLVYREVVKGDVGGADELNFVSNLAGWELIYHGHWSNLPLTGMDVRGCFLMEQTPKWSGKNWKIC
jgi:hypothetical protein